MTVAWPEMQRAIGEVFPDARQQLVAAAPYVFVFSEHWFQQDFWPHWCDVKRAMNAAMPVRPMLNNRRRGICDEISKRFVSELTLATRLRADDEDIAPAVVEATIMLGHEPLNKVADGMHRAFIVLLTRDGSTFVPYFAEPQLDFASYEITTLDSAFARGHWLVECWL